MFHDMHILIHYRCNEYRSRKTQPETYSDWFDAEKFAKERDYLEDENFDLNLGLLFNVDWYVHRAGYL